MALITCYECKETISDLALFCPHCGCLPTHNVKHANFEYENGDVYIGQRKGNLRHGKGKYRWADGRVYEGTYSENVRDGEGVYTDETGKEHIQFWKNGVALKLVRQEYEGGDYYIGQVDGNERAGWGKYFWKNGSCYTGEWKNNNRHGVGMYIDAEGEEFDQTWENDQLVEQTLKWQRR